MTDPDAVWCPTCAARPGVQCTSVQASNPVSKPHKQRITAARRRNELALPSESPRRPRGPNAPSGRSRSRGKRDRDGFPTRVRKRVRRRSGGRCEARVVGVCPTGEHPAQHMHHIWLRGQGGPDTEENALDSCQKVHDWIHDQPTRSRAIGLLTSSATGFELTQALREKARGPDGRLTP